MDFEDEVEVEQPHYAQKFRVPKDPVLLATYELYKPSWHTRNLYSERNREIFAEAFIEGDLDTLGNLCVKSLAKLGIRGLTPTLLADPELMRVFYDALDVELPLRECYLIDDQRYWRRVVLSKTLDKTLHLKRWNEFDWKSEGVSRKFVELVEECPVNVVPEQKLANLAKRVWEHVSSMHIRRLQALPEHAFERYLESDPELDITSATSDEEEISSDEPDTDLGEEGEEEESNKSEVAIQFWQMDDDDGANDRRTARRQRNAARQQARDVVARKRAEHLERKAKVQARRDAMRRKEPTKKKKKKKKELPIEDVFSISVNPEPPDDEDTKPDMRNKQLLLERIKRYDYPDEHCHHIDLGFVRHFQNLVSLTLEFLGPANVKTFHSRLLKFSDGDMVRLGKGLLCLPNLKVFKLRNGSLDVRKLRILARSLRIMDSLEELDFGFNKMPDECSEALAYLLKRPRIFRSLQLEYNRLGANTAVVLGKAFGEIEDGVLEYLGLAHNPINELALHSLVGGLVGTPHVLALNISGMETTKGSLSRDIGELLRHHKPLISLEMASNNIGVSQGVKILKSLEQNQRVLYMDCRECDLDSNQEFEVDMILRRNNYIHENLHHGENLCAVILERRHPIVQRIEEDYARRRECQAVRPKFSSSSVESIPPVVEVKEVEEERDIWAILGLRPTVASTKTEVTEVGKDSLAISDRMPTFVYEANNFDLEQFRQSVYLPGPGNRFFYLQQNKMP